MNSINKSPCICMYNYYFQVFMVSINLGCDKSAERYFLIRQVLLAVNYSFGRFYFAFINIYFSVFSCIFYFVIKIITGL